MIGRKDTQPTLAADMSQLLDKNCRTSFSGLTTDLHLTTENAHGGIEQREVRVLELPKDSPHRQTWPGLRTLAVVLKRIERDRIETYETRFYLSSLHPQAEHLARVIRAHWGIENSLHWTMDVTFQEDRHRLINRNGVSNLSAIRRLDPPTRHPHQARSQKQTLQSRNGPGLYSQRTRKAETFMRFGWVVTR